MSATCWARRAGSASVLAMRPLPEPSAMAGSTVSPAPLSWAIAQAALAAPLLKLGLSRTWTPPPDLAVAEYQNGETSVNRSAFWTAELTPSGRPGDVIQ